MAPDHLEDATKTTERVNSAHDLVVENSSEETTRDRMVFYPVAFVAFVFCLTVCLCVAAAFGEQDHPATKWVNRHGTTVLIGEVIAVVVLSLLAMAIDRRRTLSRLSEQYCHASQENDNVD